MGFCASIFNSLQSTAYVRLLSLALLICFIVTSLAPLSALAETAAGPDTIGHLRADVSTSTISLSRAISLAVQNYPTLKRTQAAVNKNAAAINLAKTAYLPSFDVLGQELRTTTNNIAGAIFPQVLNVVPMQTGPATSSSSFKSIFANDYGFNLSYLVYDGGFRKANVQVARAKERTANADIDLTLLDVQAAAAEAYLAAVSNHEVIQAQAATVERMKAYNLIVHTQVNSGLRPGVDAARADADLSAAKIALIEAEREFSLASVDLAESLGLAGKDIMVDDRPWIKQPTPVAVPLRMPPEQHPLAILRSKQVAEAQAQVKSTQKSYRPRLWFHSGMWARGSGSKIDARPVAGGTIPQNANYIAGFGLDFPVMDYFAVKAKTRMAREVEAEEKAQYDLAIQQLIKKDSRAKILYQNALKIAEQTPTLVLSARENEDKALERYRVGLCNILEPAEAQRILQNAAMQDAVAQVRVWRALLAIAYAQGDIKTFVNVAKMAEAATR
ncbi:MAG: TolC family protein [Cyanobacteria bacterium REEB67]|nr:TolC family protein [Cyanobacteria bacterium REEB67]